MISYYVIPGLKYRHEQVNQYNIASVIEIICEYLNTSKEEIASEFRTEIITYKRNILFYFLYNKSKMSMPQIAKDFNKHHTSVLHCLRRVKFDLEKNTSSFKNDIEEINKLITYKNSISNN